MVKDYLERKARKAVVNIEDKVTDISNVLYDINMKLGYIIKKKPSYSETFDGNNYFK
jgi:hypothetical protein